MLLFFLGFFSILMLVLEVRDLFLMVIYPPHQGVLSIELRKSFPNLLVASLTSIWDSTLN